MRRTALAALIATVALAACSPGDAAPPVDDALERDLQVVQGSAVELAPRAGGQEVVSAIESAPPVPTPRTRKVGRAVEGPGPRVLAARPVKAGTSDPDPVTTVYATVPVKDTVVDQPVPGPDTSTVIAAPRPSAPQRKAPKGGWWSTGDVIRNAPFPVNP